MSEKQINELLEEIKTNEEGIGFIDCGTATDYMDEHLYERIITAVKQNIELQHKNEELTKKLEDVERQGMESLLQIETLTKAQKESSDVANNLIYGIVELLTNIYAGKENKVRIGDYIFNIKGDGVDFKYEPIKEAEPIKLEIQISENSGKSNICPICNKELGQYPAISRKDNKTEICSNCGTLEALEAFYKANKEKEDEQKEV